MRGRIDEPIFPVWFKFQLVIGFRGSVEARGNSEHLSINFIQLFQVSSSNRVPRVEVNHSSIDIT